MLVSCMVSCKQNNVSYSEINSTGSIISKWHVKELIAIQTRDISRIEDYYHIPKNPMVYNTHYK